MTEYCLTIKAETIGGSISQGYCVGTDGIPILVRFGDAGCAVNIEENTPSVEIWANPDSGYEIGEWSWSPDDIENCDAPDEIFAGGVHGVVGQPTVWLTMPSCDITVTVSFIKTDVFIQYYVGSGNGCIRTEQYIKVCQSDPVATFSTNLNAIRFYGEPQVGWKIYKWTVNGVLYSGTLTNINLNEEYIDVTIGSSSITVIVFFEEQAGECIKHRLTVDIEGRGSVSVPSGLYCDYIVHNVVPISSSGYFFKEWVYSDTSIVQNGNTLIFDMSVDRHIKAVFERLSGYVERDYSIFYCPSSISRSNIVDFEYINHGDNPSGFNRFHFRATFYADSSKTKTVFSAFSLSNRKRWFYNDGAYREIPIEGVLIGEDEVMDIVFSPEILSIDQWNRQKEEFISNGDMEFHLLCGMRYYIDIEAYSDGMSNLEFIKTITMVVNCEDVNPFYRYSDRDKNNWICSGQGGSDLVISKNMGQSLFPSISSNQFEMYSIVWQSRRNNMTMCYEAFWDSDRDIVYSSGQGSYDKKIFNQGYFPIVKADMASTFYITSYINDKVYYYAVPLPSIETKAPVVQSEEIEKLCLPGQSTILSATMDNIIVRVYEEDISNSIVINKGKAVPLVANNNIRLDIEGTNALYAIRLRDSDMDQWSEWINIDVELHDIEGQNEYLDAYRITDSRVIVPWTLKKKNGLRRVCCQLLTLYGISPISCIDVYMNIDIIEYTLEFYKEESMTETDKVGIYNGLPVVSPVRDNATGAIIGNSGIEGDVSTTIYFKVIFNKNIIETTNGTDYYDGDIYEDGDFTFNLVQQGIKDEWGGVLTKITNNTFRGQFKIYRHDGVFHKDGKAFIQVILSNSSGANICLSDMSDPYNLMVNEEFVGKYSDLDVEEVFNNYKSSKISNVLDINTFKQYYNTDDYNFRFGNPDLFRK